MRAIWVAMLVLATAGWSAAQEQPSAEELNHKYQDSLNQLKAAQDRKNELATENEKLTARVADLEKQLAEARRQETTIREQTFQLRSYHAAWQMFLRRYPLLLEKWRLFIESDPLAVPSTLPEAVGIGDPLPVP